MRVMILSVSAGYGHHATAKAVGDALIARGATVETMDAYKYINRAVQQTIDKGYLFSSKRLPDLYRSCYALAENHGNGYFNLPKMPNIIQIVNALGSTRFHHVLSSFDPEVIVCTHVFAAQLMNEMKRRHMVDAPVIGVITDYTIHPYWEDVPYIEHIVIASELLCYRAVRRGITQDRLLPFGIPIHPKFNRHVDRIEACEILGVDPNRPILLLMGGSMGYSNSKRLVQELFTLDMPLQLLAVCGNNKKQLRQLTVMRESIAPPRTLHPYGFVDNVELMMSAADCIITKPGGLTVSEALAKNLPMLLANPIPGHEERNVEFLMNNGIASLITKTFPVDEAVYELFTHPSRLRTVRENMRSISHPNATELLADFILGMQCAPPEPDNKE